jgi:hypothetical protein
VQEDDEESDYLFGSNFLLRGTVSSRASLQQQKSSMWARQCREKCLGKCVKKYAAVGKTSYLRL